MAEKHSFDLPVHTNTFALPLDAQLKLAYDVYNPGKETKRLKSERRRTVFAEAFIENRNLGTLADLSVRAMAQHYGAHELDLVSSDPLKVRLHYEMLDVELPLQACHMITNTKYWRRVVLAKTKDHSLAFTTDFNWKNEAISLKFVELVEECPAEYWPEEYMTDLAILIKEYVTDMHIRRLRPLQDHSFQKNFESESEFSSDEEAEEEEAEDETSATSQFNYPEGELEENEEELKDQEYMEGVEEADGEVNVQKQESDWQLMRGGEKAKTTISKAERRENRRRERERREEHLRKLYGKKKIPTPPPIEYTKSGKPKKQRAAGIFDMRVERLDDEIKEKQITDSRNKERLLRKRKMYNYPPDDCHHIDLSFVRLFDELVTFTIEFQAPEQNRDFHKRHFNLSTQDIRNLATGVRFLVNLKIFRLRNSLMNANKFEIITGQLKYLPALQVVDFGFDQLSDDCGEGMRDLLKLSQSLKSLEFEGNDFSTNVMQYLAEAILKYRGNIEYLGLARNPLGDVGLHALVKTLVRSKKVTHLNLTSITASENGLICCIANELLRQHAPLKKLDLVAVPFGQEAGIELITALAGNKTIRELNCRGCDLDLDIEYEIKVLMKRNSYLAENSYITDNARTEEEVKAWVSRTKNPILLNALENVQKRALCHQYRPVEFRRTISEDADTDELKEHEDDVSEAQTTTTLGFNLDYDSSMFNSAKSNISRMQKFVYEPDKLNVEDFRKHTALPGPDGRFDYFHHKNRFRSKRATKFYE